jgi:Flp pilus assembly protein TadB
MSPDGVLALGASAAATALAFPAAPALPGRTASRATTSTRSGGEIPVLRVTGSVSVAMGVLLFVGGSTGAVAAVVAGATCWRVTGRLEPVAVRRRRERLEAAVPHAIDLLAACLAAGLSPGAALEQITEAVPSPLAGELADVTARLRLGVDPVTVWRELARHPQLGGLGRTVSRAVESGASVADAMLRLADDERRRSRAAVESRARAVGVKAALPLGVCLLPAFVLVGVVPLVAGSVSVLVGG